MTAKHIKADEWLPDLVMWGEQALINAKNVTPGRMGFRPLKSYVGLTTAMGSTRARGARSFRRDTGSLTTIAGNLSDLYKFTLSGKTWTDISDATYALEEDHFWSMTQFGTLAIMTSFKHPVKKYDIVTAPATVTDLGGSPPKARIAITVRDNVCLGNIEDYPSRIQWSATNDAEGWTVGTGESDFQDFPEGGQVMAGIGGNVGYWFQERMIRAMHYAPGSPYIYQIDPIDEARGSLTRRGLVSVGSTGFYLAHDGFFRFNNGQSVPIGADKVDNWFFDNVSSPFVSRTIAGLDPKKKLVFWAFISTENADNTENAFCDKVLIHHWPTGRWAWASIRVSTFLDMVFPAGTTLDDIPDMDDLTTTSLDGPDFNADGISSEVALFSDDFKMGFLNGANMEALFEYERLQFFAPNRQIIHSVMPIVDAFGVEAALAGREHIAASESFGSYVPQEATGIIPFNASARMHDLRVKVPSTSWTHSRGVVVDASQDGDL